MIKAVVFDCFGVLTTDAWLTFRDEHFGDNPELMAEARANNVRVNQGLMPYDGFIGWAAQAAGMSFAETKQRIEGTIPNRLLLEYIRDSLASRYRIGMLSNAADNWLVSLFEPWQVELFDEVVLSYAVGAVKPHPVMYEAVCTKLGVLPEEAIFIDDIERFVVGAEQVGMKGVLYKNSEQTIAAIEEKLNA